jgi:PAS domain S-box-containing protein
MSAGRGTAGRVRPAARIPLQSVLALPLAAVIFAVDTFTPLASAVAVLYGIVIMLAGGALHGRRLVLAAAGCAVLTAVSFVARHGWGVEDSSFVRCVVSLSAIAVTTFLVLRNQAASEVLRSQAALLDLTHDAVFVRNFDDVILYWNRGAEELYGWSTQEAVGARSHDILHTRFPGELAAINAELFRDDRWDGELAHRSRDGAELVVASRWALLRSEGGQPTAVLETNTDITTRKRADAELLQAQADLAHASRLTTLGQFTATIAHEVNQPLGAIATNSEAALRFLGRPEPDLGEVREALNRIILGSNRASDVVARTRALLRKGTPEKVPLNLGEVIGEAALLVQRELQRGRVLLTLEVEPAIPPVVGDRVQLQQVIINLLINAAHAMERMDDPRRLVVRAVLTEDRSVRVQVRDTGVGIAEADMERLFGSFFTTKADGMGLGLAVCRSIVEAHGGRIAAERVDGPGALIAFTLPLADGA